MLLTVLGCAGSVPGPNAPTSGYLLESEGFLLGMDLGHGTLGALLAIRDPFDLDALLFSHLHPDHCADFAGLTVFRRYHPAPPRNPVLHRLPVYGPSELHSRLAAAYAPDEEELAQTDLSDVYDFHPIASGSVNIGPFTVRAGKALHPCESFSFRISSGGRSIVYTGDTGFNDRLVELASGVDLLLSEATWTHGEDRPADLHMSGREAGELATRSDAGRLLVTHVSPFIDSQAVLAEARSVYPGEVALAQQGRRYPV
ncbi:MAG: MBL fold metallo-hydrolase [Labedaea sp.]